MSNRSRKSVVFPNFVFQNLTMKTVALSIWLSVLFVLAASAHPVHVSVTNMDMVEDSGYIDYSIRLFYDDFQSLINYTYNTQLDFTVRNRLTNKEQSAILDYLRKSFQLREANKLLNAEFRGWKKEDVSVSFLFRTSIDPEQPELEIKNTLMLDLFTDQTNLVIMQGKGDQSGWEFTKRDTLQSLLF